MSELDLNYEIFWHHVAILNRELESLLATNSHGLHRDGEGCAWRRAFLVAAAGHFRSQGLAPTRQGRKLGNHGSCRLRWPQIG
jgi:hypothetical protein